MTEMITLLGCRRLRGISTRILGQAAAAALVLVFGGSLPGTVKPVTALQCFSSTDCSVGGALSTQKQQCGPTEIFCVSVHRQKRVSWMGHSWLDRGCASSLNIACASDGEVMVDPGTGDTEIKSTIDSSSLSYQCCSTDFCNGPDEAQTEGYRKSEEHLRNLMEGNPRRAPRISAGRESGASAGEGGTSGSDDNSAQSSPRSSRLATILVIVGTFSQVLWLVGSLLQ